MLGWSETACMSCSSFWTLSTSRASRSIAGLICLNATSVFRPAFSKVALETIANPPSPSRRPSVRCSGLNTRSAGTEIAAAAAASPPPPSPTSAPAEVSPAVVVFLSAALNLPRAKTESGKSSFASSFISSSGSCEYSKAAAPSMSFSRIFAQTAAGTR